MKLGDRVIWQSQSNGFWAEKIGTVIFMGPKGWFPEEAPPSLEHWLSREWRDTIKRRGEPFPRPAFSRKHTTPSRYRFDKCASGVVVAVHEYTQLNANTKQVTVKKPKRPLFYAPSIKGRKGLSSKLRVWPKGRAKPTFKVQDAMVDTTGLDDLAAQAADWADSHDDSWVEVTARFPELNSFAGRIAYERVWKRREKVPDELRIYDRAYDIETEKVEVTKVRLTCRECGGVLVMLRGYNQQHFEELLREHEASHQRT